MMPKTASGVFGPGGDEGVKSVTRVHRPRWRSFSCATCTAPHAVVGWEGGWVADVEKAATRTTRTMGRTMGITKSRYVATKKRNNEERDGTMKKV